MNQAERIPPQTTKILSKSSNPINKNDRTNNVTKTGCPTPAARRGTQEKSRSSPAPLKHLPGQEPRMQVATLVQRGMTPADLPSLGFPPSIYCTFLCTAAVF